MRGGNTHFLTSIGAVFGTAEYNPGLAVIPFIHGGYWLDYQSGVHPAGTVHVEGDMEATFLSGMTGTLDFWLITEPVAGITLYLPMFWAFCIIDLFDAGTPPVGDPNDFAPTVFPNFFLRDWGRNETILGPPTYPLTDAPGYAMQRPSRCLLRGFPTIPAGQANCDGNESFHRFRFRLKPHLIRARQALCLCLGVTNSSNTNQTITCKLAATFGYRHSKTQ